MDAKLPIISLRIIVVHPNGRVLLLKRAASGQNSSPAWCLPGGKMQYGETARAGAARELEEETGINCPEKDLRFLFYQDSPAMESGAMHCVNLYFSCFPKNPIVTVSYTHLTLPTN